MGEETKGLVGGAEWWVRGRKEGQLLSRWLLLGQKFQRKSWLVKRMRSDVPPSGEERFDG